MLNFVWDIIGIHHFFWPIRMIILILWCAVRLSGLHWIDVAHLSSFRNFFDISIASVAVSLDLSGLKVVALRTSNSRHPPDLEMAGVVIITDDLRFVGVTIHVAYVFDISAEFDLSFLVAIITIHVFYAVTMSLGRYRLDFVNLTTKRLKNPKIIKLVVLLRDAVQDHLAFENVAVFIVVTSHEFGEF